MMTAEQQKIYDKVYGKHNISAELHLIEKHIEEISNTGKEHGYIDCRHLYPENKQILKNLGYEVEYNILTDYWRIKW